MKSEFQAFSASFIFFCVQKTETTEKTECTENRSLSRGWELRTGLHLYNEFHFILG
jgi:hypothetical protein